VELFIYAPSEPLLGWNGTLHTNGSCAQNAGLFNWRYWRKQT